MIAGVHLNRADLGFQFRLGILKDKSSKLRKKDPRWGA